MNASPRIAPFTATGSAPCKINLTLDVFAPRPDGFHDLASLVVLMAYPADTVTVSVKHGSPDAPTQITLTCDDPTLPTDEKNLAFRAARDFARAFLPADGVRVHVDLIKRLPHQAGLGGGSSDAATVLRLLSSSYIEGMPEGRRNPMNRLSLQGKLEIIAAQIGSDVPLFLLGSLVLMEGRGDKVRPLPYAMPPIFGVIVKPAVGVPTGPAFALLDALPHQKHGLPLIGGGFVYHGKTTALQTALRERQIGDAAKLGPLLHNDFEAAVLPAYPEVARAHQAVQEAGAVRALLCGSGSAIFGLADDKNHARELARRLRGKFPYVAETSTLADGEPINETDETEPRADG